MQDSGKLWGGLLAVLLWCGLAFGQEADSVERALAAAGDNRPQLEKALAEVPEDQASGLEFLLTHMPERDLKSLSAEFLLENSSYAYRARDEAPWKKILTDEIFFNDVLPYANINERRDAWRKDFYHRFRSKVKDAASASEAAAILNQHIFGELKVRYSTERPKPDQSPYESMKAGTASCTGLSILLIAACRAVGVPARFVGTPLWSDGSGNHSWVEIWDRGWHFTGAAEPTGKELNRAWFEGRAAKALRDDAKRAIYAVSYRKTPQVFPILWAPKAEYVSAVNVTDRYTSRGFEVPKGKGRVRFVFFGADGKRRAVDIRVQDQDGKDVFAGRTKDERFDANDHLTAALDLKAVYSVRWGKDSTKGQTFLVSQDEQLVSNRKASVESEPLSALKEHLDQDPGKRPELAEQPFAQTALSKAESEQAKDMLWQDHVATIRRSRAAEMKDRVLKHGKHEMKFFYRIFGEKPAKGRSLYISMHGGGGAPARVNDQQWRNQQRLYEPKEGVYVAPRAPTDTWNLWHQGHIDPLFDRLIENMVVFEDVDPDRVYIMGYSAGGDGVYQLAPRMADRWAAAAMMAGHPNETVPLGLRNIGFILQMGGKDRAYRRNAIAGEWKEKLAELQKDDPKGYRHLVKIYPEKGHWMDREDAMALPWMAKFRRDLRPKKIVWRQDDVLHSRFYWVAVPKDQRTKGADVVATLKGQRVDVSLKGPKAVVVRLDDRMCDLDRPVTVSVNGTIVTEEKAKRSIAVLSKTLRERGDREGMFSAELTITTSK